MGSCGCQSLGYRAVPGCTLQVESPKTGAGHKKRVQGCGSQPTEQGVPCRLPGGPWHRADLKLKPGEETATGLECLGKTEAETKC